MAVHNVVWNKWFKYSISPFMLCQSETNVKVSVKCFFFHTTLVLDKFVKKNLQWMKPFLELTKLDGNWDLIQIYYQNNNEFENVKLL